MHKKIVAALFTGSLLAGGAIGSALLGGGVATAQSSSSDSTSSSIAPAPPDGVPHGPGGPGRHGGPHDRIDLSVAAGAIGVPEADLQTALQSGQSLADVATANSVDPQKVIDALVADAQTKLAARVASGEITQAQADAISANLVDHITNIVNHTGGPGGAGCPGMDGSGPPADAGSSSSSSSGANSSGASLGT